MHFLAQNKSKGAKTSRQCASLYICYLGKQNPPFWAKAPSIHSQNFLQNKTHTSANFC